MLVLNLPFKALMFLTLMRPSLVLFLVLWLKLVKDFLKVRCRLALLPFLISCLIWLDLRSEERFSRNAETDLVCRLLLEKKKLAPSVCRMTFPILACLLVRLVVLLPFQLLRLSLATPSRWTPLALSVFLHCVVALLLTLL